MNIIQGKPTWSERDFPVVEYFHSFQNGPFLFPCPFLCPYRDLYREDDHDLDEICALCGGGDDGRGGTGVGCR